MMQGKTGQFIMQGSGGVSLRLSWSEEYDAGANTSSLSVTSAEIKLAYPDSTSAWINGRISIDGVSAVEFSALGKSHTVTTVPLDWSPIRAFRGEPAPWTVGNIPHAANGRRESVISVSVRLFGEHTQSIGTQSVNGEETVELTAIPRASVISAYPGTVGSPVTLTLSRFIPGARHELRYSLGTASGVIASDLDSASVQWTPPMELCREVTDAPSAEAELTCLTYVDGVFTGESTCALALSVPDSVGLRISEGWCTLSPDNTGTPAEDIAAFVQGMSRARAVFDSSLISTEQAYGAGIAGFSLKLGAAEYASAPYMSGLLTEPGSMTAQLSVTDTRGRRISESAVFTVHPYSPPTLSGVTMRRCLADGTPSDEGTFILAEAVGHTSPIGGLNTAELKAQWRSRGGEFCAGETIRSGIASVFGSGLIDVGGTYEARIVITDALGGTASCMADIPTAFAAFHILPGGAGAAFGKYAETERALELAEGWSLKLGDTELTEAQLAALLEMIGE